MSARYASHSKYRNKIVYDDDICFRSLLEWRRYKQLKLLLSAGIISNLKIHTRYRFIVNGIKIRAAYEDDFSYDETETGRHIVEDTKGVRTGEFRIKKDLMKACHNIDVIEVTQV
jgi:Protein of unknown function (DUF1064)